MAVGYIFQGSLDVDEDLAKIVVQHFSCFCQRNAARIADEQWHIQHFFKRFHMDTGHCLADEQALCGFGKGATIYNGDESLNSIKVIKH